MRRGPRANGGSAESMAVAMILYAGEAINASTFAATAAGATLGDLYSTITAALSTLKGPLHGGAIEASLNTIERIGHPKEAEEFVLNTLRNKRRSTGSATASTRRTTRGRSSSRTSPGVSRR